LPPIAPLGEALAALGDRRAAPLLAGQLNRPAHTASAIARAAEALEELASDAEFGELSVFFSLHRTTADGPEWVAAVVSVARTLLRVGGRRAHTLIELAIRDPLTIADVREALERELGNEPAGSTSLSPPASGSKADLVR
jgi:outer membrane protein assembly factor BamB